MLHHVIVHSNYVADWLPHHARAERPPFAVFSAKRSVSDLSAGDIAWLATGIPNSSGEAFLCGRLVVERAGLHHIGLEGFNPTYSMFNYAAWANPRRSEYCEPFPCPFVEALPWWRQAIKSVCPLTDGNAFLLETVWGASQRRPLGAAALAGRGSRG